jgi:hypothetical protein
MIKEGELDPRWVGALIPRELWHFHRQLLDRYNIVLAPGEFSAIAEALRSGRAKLIERRESGQSIHSVRLPTAQERIYVLAYGPRIITAWPPERRLNAIRRNLMGNKTSPVVTH